MIYEATETDGYTHAVVCVSDEGGIMGPTGFLRLDYPDGGGRMAIELTPDLINRLVNRLFDVSNILEEHEEKAVATA